MKITDVLKRVDEVYPNNYTEEEKFRWCDEVSAEVMQEVKKQYVQLACRIFPDGFVELPQNVSIEQVKYVFYNGRRMDKVEFMRRFHFCPYGVCDREGVPKNGVEMSVVFLPEHRPVRRWELRAECDLIPDPPMIDDCNDGEKYESGFEKAYEGKFTVCSPDISVGDNLEVVQITAGGEPDWSNAVVYYVLGFDFDGTQVACDVPITETKNANFAMRRKLLDKTVVPPPYDKMYIEYLLAQITYYQHDYDEYNIHLGNYMSMFDSCAKWYKSRAPLDDCARLRNFW